MLGLAFPLFPARKQARELSVLTVRDSQPRPFNFIQTILLRKHSEPTKKRTKKGNMLEKQDQTLCMLKACYTDYVVRSSIRPLFRYNSICDYRFSEHLFGVILP